MPDSTPQRSASQAPYSVSIVGCGWVGLPVGGVLAQEGHVVRGSTTRNERYDVLASAGIEPFVTTLAPELTPPTPELFESEVLLCTLPPGRSNADDTPYTDQIAALMARAQAQGVQRVIYTSSTGVYPPTDGPVTEDAVDPRTPRTARPPARDTGNAVRAAEQIIVTAYPNRSVILRLGGLFGPDRHPGRFIAGRTDVARPEGPVNMVHRDDLVGIIQAAIADSALHGVFNVVAPEHPTRRAFYEAAARDYGGDAPTFAEVPATGGKRVLSNKLINTLGYTFMHPDPAAPFHENA